MSSVLMTISKREE